MVQLQYESYAPIQSPCNPPLRFAELYGGGARTLEDHSRGVLPSVAGRVVRQALLRPGVATHHGRAVEEGADSAVRVQSVVGRLLARSVLAVLRQIDGLVAQHVRVHHEEARPWVLRWGCLKDWEHFRHKIGFMGK